MEQRARRDCAAAPGRGPSGARTRPASPRGPRTARAWSTACSLERSTAPTTRPRGATTGRGKRPARPTWVAGRCRRRRSWGGARAARDTSVAVARLLPPSVEEVGVVPRSARPRISFHSRPASRAYPAGPPRARRRRPPRHPGRAAAREAPCGRPSPRSGSGSCRRPPAPGRAPPAAARRARRGLLQGRGRHPRPPGTRQDLSRRPSSSHRAAAAVTRGRASRAASISPSSIRRPPSLTWSSARPTNSRPRRRS